MDRKNYLEARLKIDEYLKRLEDPHCQERDGVVDFCVDYPEDYCPKTCTYAREMFSNAGRDERGDSP